MNLKTMTATKLRLILLGALSGIILAHIGIPLLGQHLLRQNSSSVTEAISHETSSRETLERLERAQRQLKEQSDTVEKAKNLFADASSYNYQRQVIEDVNTYASMIGVGVTGYSFSDGSAEAGAPGPAAAPSAAPPATSAPTAGATPSAGPSPAAGNPSNAKTVTVTVNLQSPIEYTTFLKFIKLLQGNVTQFKLQTINFSGGGSSANSQLPSESPLPSTSTTSVDMSSITMEVYIKQ